MVWKPTAPENCIQYSADTRHPYEDISCLLTHDDTLRYFSPLAKTYMDWEFVTQLRAPSKRVIGYTVVASAVIMSVGNYWMLFRRRPFQIRPIVTVWNCVWMMVTGLGCLRLLPQVVHNFVHHTARDNVCGSSKSLWLSGTTGLWGAIWIYAKILEVIVESILVVLLQQPCGLLQWFNNYAYVLIHGWHLYTSPVPGGSSVLCVYYAIVWFMNLYCFYLNWNRLPQPQTPTALLDGIHLVQTLSGVVLSVTTLHYWKQAIWNHIPCDANEPHIRMLAFSWSGGHVVIALLNYLNNQFVESQRRKAPALFKKKKSKKGTTNSMDRSAQNHHMDGSSKNNNKTVTFAETNDGKKKKKQLAPSKDQLPKADPTPELVEESTSSTSESARSKRKKNRIKNIPNSIEIDNSQQDEPIEEVAPQPASSLEDSNRTSASEGTEASSNNNSPSGKKKKKKKKKKNNKTKSE